MRVAGGTAETEHWIFLFGFVQTGHIIKYLAIIGIMPLFDFDQERGPSPFNELLHPTQDLHLETFHIDFDEIDPCEVYLLREVVELCNPDLLCINAIKQRGQPFRNGFWSARKPS